MTGKPRFCRPLMTGDQLDASANDPCTSTTVGLGVGAAAAGPALTAALPKSTATTRPATHVRILRLRLEMTRSILVPSFGTDVLEVSTHFHHCPAIAPGNCPGLRGRAEGRSAGV